MTEIELVTAFVIILAGLMVWWVVVPRIMDKARRIFFSSVAITGTINDKYVDSHGKRLADDHIAYVDSEQITGAWFVIGETHLTVGWRLFDKFKEGDVVTANVIGNRATRVYAGSTPDAVPIEKHEAQLLAEEMAGVEERTPEQQAWEARVVKLEGIRGLEVEVDTLQNVVYVNGKFFGDYLLIDHEVCGTPLILRYDSIYDEKPWPRYCLRCEVVVPKSEQRVV